LQYPKEIIQMHEEIKQKILLMLPERWKCLYLYASVIEHFDNLQTGEMFFYYYPKGILKQNPINVYEVPARYNIDENQYYRLAEDLYNNIKVLRKIQIENNEKAWSNITIVIENLKYKAIYGYEELGKDKLDNVSKRIIWTHRYLHFPYESFNKKERAIIDKYKEQDQPEESVFELPAYERNSNKELKKMKGLEEKLEFVTEETIKEMEFRNNHIPKSQILN